MIKFEKINADELHEKYSLFRDYMHSDNGVEIRHCVNFIATCKLIITW
jgi:hypothetical protein